MPCAGRPAPATRAPQGNRTPHTDALSRGAVAGLTLAHGRGHVFRALIESICYGDLEGLRRPPYKACGWLAAWVVQGRRHLRRRKRGCLLPACHDLQARSTSSKRCGTTALRPPA